MILIDTHCDALYRRAWQQDKLPDVTPQRLRDGGVTVQVCALWAGPKGPGQKPDADEYVAREYERLTEFTGAGIRLIDDPSEAQEGENCVMLSIEGGEAIGTSLDKLRDFRKKGVRLIALTWNFENEIGSPALHGSTQPLKPFGWETVREMNRLGIACDVSHLNEAGFWNLIEKNDLPPMASHSCCRALRDHPRNLTDDQIRALIERNGWVGINFYPRFLTDGEACIDDIVRHIDHMAGLGGIQHVGFGSDFDGIEVSPVDLDHPGLFPNLLDALRRRGYDEATVEDIAGKSFLRYMKQFER